MAADSPASTRLTSGAHVLNALVDRTGIDPVAVEDVVFGCLDTIGSQAGDIARTCWLAAGLPEEVPGIDHRPPVRLVAAGRALCRSGASCSGTQDLVVAGGVQNMSTIPIVLGDARRGPVRHQRPVLGVDRLGEALRHPGGEPVRRRRDDRR
ncbi:MAG: hypothetical protein V9E94_17025 [Microthrixaceae bacterium]